VPIYVSRDQVISSLKKYPFVNLLPAKVNVSLLSPRVRTHLTVDTYKVNGYTHARIPNPDDADQRSLMDRKQASKQAQSWMEPSSRASKELLELRSQLETTSVSTKLRTLPRAMVCLCLTARRPLRCMRAQEQFNFWTWLRRRHAQFVNPHRFNSFLLTTWNLPMCSY
jgi:hypothetical protein